MTSNGAVLITHKTHDRDNGHQTPIGDFKTPKRDDNRHLTYYGASMRTLQREEGTSRTREGDFTVKDPAREHRTPQRYSSTTLNRDNGIYSSPGGEKLSIHGSRNKWSLSLTTIDNNNKKVATFKSDKSPGEQILGTRPVKLHRPNYRMKFQLPLLQDSQHTL